MPIQTTTISSNTPFTVSKIHSTIFSFSKVSRLNTMQNKTKELDLLDILGLLSKSSLQLFLQLKNNLNYRTNTSEINITNFSKSQKDTLRKKYKELIKYNLIKIGKNKQVILKGCYVTLPKGKVLISPYHIIPPNQYQESILLLWDSL